MRLSPWLAPLTAPRKRLSRRVVRRRTASRLAQLTEQLETRTLLTAFTVDSFFDTVDADPGDGFAFDETGRTSLRAAVMEANATSGLDIINLGSGIFNLSIIGSDEDGGATGDLDITDDLQIFGQSAETTFIDARGLDRVFDIFSGSTVVLFNVTITGGDLAGRGDGGAVRVDGGTLFLDDSVITDSRASNGGAIFNNGGNITINRSTLSDNSAEGDPSFGQGGAIESIGGSVTVDRSAVHDNTAFSGGGGVAMIGGVLSVESSTIAQNSAGDSLASSGDGGGIHLQSGASATLLASTVAFNSAGNEGGGIWTDGSVTLERTLLSNNSTSSGSGPEGFISGGTVTSEGYNLVREDTDFSFTTSIGDQIGTSTTPIDTNLLGLADNGGSTLTIELGALSPAIDAGPPPGASLFLDQRGFPRERDGDRNGSIISDIGAFELRAPRDFFVDFTNGGTITSGPSGDFAGDFEVTLDQGASGILDAGDIVTFDPFGQPVFGLEFGTRAFGTIDDALSAARISPDNLNEVVLGAGTYNGGVMLDIGGLFTLRGHTGIATDVVIDGGGGPDGIFVTGGFTAIESLRVTNAVTGIDVAPSPSGQFFGAINVQSDGNSGDGLRIFDSTGQMDIPIQDSTFTGNTGDGINASGVNSLRLRNVSSTSNNQDGLEVSNTSSVEIDIVSVSGNSGMGFNLDTVDTIAAKDPRTSSNSSGNLFSNTSVLLFNGVEGDVTNSTTITGSEIRFDAGSGAVQENISLTNVTSVFVTGDDGNDTITVDYNAGAPPGGRELFLDGGSGRDTIQTSSDTHQQLTNARLTIGGIDEIAITSFEQASLTGGSGNNNLNATEFFGQVTLSGLDGQDTLRGSAGNDVLDGGSGDDLLFGGPLVDQYINGVTPFESLDLNDTDSSVVTILDETDTDVETVNLDEDFFRFGDITYSGNSLFVAPSGVISLGGQVSPQNNFDLTDVPEAVADLPILAPLFDDWLTGLNSPPGLTLPDAKVLYLIEDTNADFINDRLIIEWNEVYHRDQIDTMTTTPSIKSGASPVTFQLILELNTFERDGDITFNYVDLDTGTAFPTLADGASATVGGKDGDDNPQSVQQISFNSSDPLIASTKALIAQVGLSDGDDLLIGGSGDDTLSSASGLDLIDGGLGGNDQFVLDGFRNPFPSDHQIDGFSIDSSIREMPDRIYESKASYLNIEALELGFGAADQNLLVDLNGLPSAVSINTRGPSASDSVTINGTTGDDVLTLSGTSLTNGNTTVDLAGVEDLTIDISSGGSDSVSIDQTSTAAARDVLVTGDSTDDSVSVQSTNKSQDVQIFVEDDQSVVLREMLDGDLILEEVLSDGGDDGSENTIENQQAPDQVVVSSDGTRVYVAASDSDSLVVYNRDRVTGDLTFNESLVNGGMDTFGGTITGLDGASNVIVSADGRHIYVASEVDRTVAFFVLHEGDNQLTFISSTLFDGAGDVFNIDLPSSMAFSPDETVLLVSSESGNLVAQFEVAENGDLTLEGLLTDGGLDSGSNTIDGLGGASSIAISPDGRHMYVTGATDNAIAVFTGDSSGLNAMSSLPLYVETLTNGGLDGASNIISGLAGASSVAVSPDGRFVYATGETSNSIAAFGRNPQTGRLTFIESLTDSGVDSDSNMIEELLNPASVTVSPVGNRIYVAASGSDAVSVFGRDFVTGELSYRETLVSGSTDGAGNLIAGTTEVSSVFASTDGQHVYASGTGDDAIVRFDAPRDLDVTTDGQASISVTTSDADDFVLLGSSGESAIVIIDTGGTIDNDTVVAFLLDDTLFVTGGQLNIGDSALTLINTEDAGAQTLDGNNTVNVTASSDGPQFFVFGGTNTTGVDTLNIDAQESQASDNGSEVTFSGGFQSVSYDDIDSVAISNAAPIADDDSFMVPEDSPVETPVGTVTASDPELGESLTYRILSGNTGDAFTINSMTGEISVDAVLDFEALPSYALVIEVEDSQSLTDTATITVNVTDVEPAISDQSFNVPENQPNGTSVGIITLDPGDTNSVDFSINGGNTGTAFAINSSTGEITVANTSAIDFETGNPFSLLVQVTDDGGTTTDTATVTINVTAPPPAGFVFDDAVDSGLGMLVGPSATLDNGPGDATVFISSVDAYGQFNSATYDPVGGDVAAETTFDSEVYFRFGNTGPRQSLIDASAGSGSSIRSLNDEANSSFSIGDLTFSLTQTLEPVFDEFENQTGTLLTQTYRVTNTGTSTQNFEVVRYLDGDLLFDESLIDGGGRLQLPEGDDLLFETDAGTTPETSTTFLGITGFGGTIPTTERFQIEDFDQLQTAILNGAALTNSLSNFGEPVDNNDDQFIDAGLEFDVALALTNSFALNASQSTIYTTHTLFGTDSPVEVTGNTAPTVNPASFNIDENSNVGTSVGTVVANDVETPSNLTFAIVDGDPDGFFAINSSSGEITIARPDLDHEASDTVDLTVQVTDPGSLSASTIVSITVNDLNDSPVLDPIGDLTAFVDFELSFTVTATDPDVPPSDLIFSLGSGAPTGASITSDGEFTFTPTSAQDEMTFPVTFIVTEDDADALFATETIMISVTEADFDFGDAPDTYGTTLANDGPQHVVSSLFLGDTIDNEDDGIPHPMALGDDLDGRGMVLDDEDGVTFLSALSVGTTRQFRVFASEAGFLDAWIDFNQDGEFGFDENLSSTQGMIPEGESSGGQGGGGLVGALTAGTSFSIPAGFSTISFSVPETAVTGATFGRFRLSSEGNLSPTGLAVDGEVEDYQVVIDPAPAGNSNSIEPALNVAVDGFFNAFPDELNDPDPTITGNELPLAVQAENGAQAERVNGEVDLDQTDPALRTVVAAINEAVNQLEADRGNDENILVLATHPVDFLLRDPQGRTVGFTQAQGTVNEIGADATFTGDGVVELLTIRNADPGEYSLQLVGVGGVFRGGTSLITPTGTQQVTFQGSLAQNSDVQLALTYQEGIQNLPSRTDLEKVDFSEIADVVARIPTAESEAQTLAAGATEALASIALDQLDATMFSRKEDPELILKRLLEQVGEASDTLLDAIETSLDDDDLDALKLVFGDTPEDADNVEVLARVLLETLSGPLVSVPRQVDDLSGSLQQLLEQLRKQQDNQQPPGNNGRPDGDPDAANENGAAKAEAEDKRTSQRSRDRSPTSVINSAFVVNSGATTDRQVTLTAARNSNSEPDNNHQQLRGPKFIARTPSQSSDEAAVSSVSPAEDNSTNG